jgi:phospholipid/cholesterol/gamma-HCH transport system substrate-binding protein
MNRNRIINLKVGITVIISIFILLYGIAFLKDFKVNLRTNDLVVYFSDVNGLQEGDQVGVNGVPKGKVTSIDLEGDSVKVLFNLSKDVVLKKDYYISIAMIELMSGKQISIKPGKSNELQDISKPLIGSKSNDVVTLIETMNNVGDEVKEISLKIDKTVDNMNSAVKNINDIVGDASLKSNIKGTALNFNTASQNLVGLLEENRQSLKTLTSRLNSIADNVDETVIDTKPELKQTFDDIKDLTNRLDSIAFNFNNILITVKDSSSTVGKLLTDHQLYNNLNKAILSMDKLIKQIKEKGIKLRLF